MSCNVLLDQVLPGMRLPGKDILAWSLVTKGRGKEVCKHQEAVLNGKMKRNEDSYCSPLCFSWEGRSLDKWRGGHFTEFADGVGGWVTSFPA